ncbi:MAG: hypothetical protein ACRDSP_15745 [Pseudonocardiaceae bacterium]
MVLRWRYEDPEGAAMAGPEITFDDQADAEEWLGHEWQGLLDGGVEAVTLLDGADEVYGPMSLRP